MSFTSERLHTLQLARTTGIGPVTFRKLVARFGSASAVIQAWSSFAKNGKELASLSSIEDEITKVEKASGWFILIGDSDYPPALAALTDPPLTLIGLGNKSFLSTTQVGMVGTRTASAQGRKWFGELAQQLAQNGVTVTSGLARGMDGAAHEGALTGGGKTIAVVGGGADQIYPPEHRLLRERIIQNGAVISEMPWGTPIRADLFPRRNRIIAGLSHAVVVAEADRHSGSLITAQYALEFGREVLAVPGSPSDPRASGPNWLLKNGATLVENAQDVLDILPTLRITAQMPETKLEQKVQPSLFSAPTPSPAPIIHDTDEPQTLLSLLSTTPTDLDTLVRALGQSEADTTAQLIEMELFGQARREPDGRWSRA